jgi:hypothetical protein
LVLKNIEDLFMAKIKLIEQINVRIDKANIEIPDKQLLIESEGKTHECRGILRNVPVTKYTENLNGRVYNKQLWENVHKRKMFEDSYCFADHAKDDGSVKDIAGVWKNFRLNEDFACADIYCVGEHGERLLEIASLGKVGFSTVGFGEFLEESKVVNPETYEYSNTDWVVNPSQEVYGTAENVVKEEKIEENKKIIENKVISFEENITNKIDTNKHEKEVFSMNRTEQASLKNQVRVALKEAKSNSDFDEAIKDLKEIAEIIPEDMSGTADKISEAIDAIIQKQKVKSDSTESTLKEKEEELDVVKAELETTKASFTEMTERYKKLEAILETIGISEENQEDIKKMKENIEKMKEDIESFEEDRELMEKDLKAFEEDIEKRDYDINCLVEDRETMEKDIVKFEELIVEKEKEVEVNKTKIEEYEMLLKNYGYSFETPVETPVEETSTEEDDIQTYQFSYDEEVEEKETEDKIEEQEDDEKEKKDDKEKKDKEDDDKEKKEEEVEETEPTIKAEILDFYKKVVVENESLKDIKTDILKSNSLMEATEVVQNFLNNKEEKVVKIEESVERKIPRPEWLGNRF